MDLKDLMRQFGVDDDTADSVLQNPQLQKLMKFPGMDAALDRVSGMVAQGGVMPDDLDSIAEQMGGMNGEGLAGGFEGGFDDLFAGMSNLMGGMGFDEIDLDEEVEAYEPEAVDAGDRAFVIELKAWLKDTLTDIPESDVCMLEIGYHLGYDEANTPGGDLWLAYNTLQTDAENREKNAERWNFVNWTDDSFRSLDAEPLTEWCESQGYDLEEDDEDLKRRIYDLAALAVMELHQERFTEQRFGRKVPFIIEDFEYHQQTAIRAVKANGGRELFDEQFFADCGFSEDDE
ncbi:MAG: hypothetical protein IKI77_10615 [Oscillospiraceae bacterium]|nr:hypothetical protein [Oscillospiraceae bacterium]